jgi:four helix bundle protein
MKAEDFRKRTKRFALDIIQMVDRLPRRNGIQILINQVVRSGTSIAANFREACRARSKAEFISKIEVCAQEADECQLWIELLLEGYGVEPQELDRLWNEADELISILVTMAKRAKGKN